VSIAPLTAEEIRHLPVLENPRLRLSTSFDDSGARISGKINDSDRENGTKCCFGHFIPGAVWCAVQDFTLC